jgi:hypothetical protein
MFFRYHKQMRRLLFTGRLGTDDDEIATSRRRRRGRKKNQRKRKRKRKRKSNATAMAQRTVERGCAAPLGSPKRKAAAGSKRPAKRAQTSSRPSPRPVR